MSGVLSKGEILDRLLGEERDGQCEPEIFTPGTWREEQLRSAGYDLRVSTNIRAFNDTIFADDQRHGEQLTLEAGDTAFVLSVERFLMPWNIAANLGLRFGYARQGLSVLTGLLVDPGFGWRKINGSWVPEGAYLHFFLVNVGSDPISIKLGEDGSEVLSLQFLHTKEVPEDEREEKLPPGDIAPAKALRTYRKIDEVKKDLAQEQTRNKDRFAKLESELGHLATELRITRSASDNTVVFGIFILTITLLGVIVSILLEVLAGDEIKSVIERLNEIHPEGTSGTIVVALALLAIPTCLALGAFCAAKLYRLKLESKKVETNAEERAG